LTITVNTKGGGSRTGVPGDRRSQSYAKREYERTGEKVLYTDPNTLEKKRYEPQPQRANVQAPKPQASTQPVETNITLQTSVVTPGQTETKTITAYNGQPRSRELQIYQESLTGNYNEAQRKNNIPAVTVDYETLTRKAAEERAKQKKEGYTFGAGITNPKAAFLYTSAGAARVLATILKTATRPLGTTKDTVTGTAQTLSAAKNNPEQVKAAIIEGAKKDPVGLVGEALLFDKAISATGTAIVNSRFIGKTPVAGAEITSPRFNYGIDYYPQTPNLQAGNKQILSNIKESGVVYSASPERLAGGADKVTILTQAQKKAQGLPLSETGGLYAADRLSPVFTQKIGGSESSFGIGMPKLGAEGSVQVVKTEAARLPPKLRTSMSAGNKFLDEQAATTNPRTAFISPAREVRGKTEAEVIIPGGSVLQRVDDISAIQRLTKRDFNEFTFIPTRQPLENAPQSALRYINAKGELVTTPPGQTFVGMNVYPLQPLALRKYENLGNIDLVNQQGNLRRTPTLAKDLEGYRAPIKTESGNIGAISALYGPQNKPTSSAPTLSPPKSSTIAPDVQYPSSPAISPSTIKNAYGGSKSLTGGSGSSRRSGGGSSKPPSIPSGGSGGGSISTPPSIPSGGGSGGGRRPASIPSPNPSGSELITPELRYNYPKPSGSVRSGSRQGTPQAFRVLVRVKGQFKPVASRPLSKEQATDLGALRVRNTAAASFKLQAVGGTPVKSLIAPQTRFIQRDFYTSRKDTGVKIQKATNRINTFGEKKEIPGKAKQVNFLRGRTKNNKGLR
jgi:hypothetical protein